MGGFILLLQACTASGPAKPDKQIGMHIDAVLEFAVEYPLAWQKDRRVAYGSRQGEVRWTETGHSGTLLQIRSYFTNPEVATRDAQIKQVLEGYPGLVISSREEVTLPAGEALRISGHSKQSDLVLYLLVHQSRSYLISLKTPKGDIDDFRDLLDRVTNSFQAIP